MKRATLVVACLAFIAAPVLAAEQISREIPLQFANAVEVAAVFSDKPLPRPPAGDFEGFIKRCLTTAFSDFPANAWNWQTYLETQSELRVTVDKPAVGSGKLLPEGMAEPPVAVTERNALRVKGTSAALAELGELVAMLDRPVQQVGLQVECLNFFGRNHDNLPGVSWSTGTGDSAPKGVQWCSGGFDALLAREQDNAGCVGANAGVRSNRMAQVRIAEVLPHSVILKQNEPPTRRTHYRALRLDLQPRVNADGSVTITADGQLSACSYSEETGEQNSEPAAVPFHGQFRVGKGETLLLKVVTPWEAFPDLWSEHEQFGARRLHRPIIAITPRVLGAEQPYAPDMGPLDSEVGEKMLNVIFGRALRDQADGIMFGMDDQGKAVLQYRTGPDQWEPVMILPSYMLRPLLHGLIDPAGEGTTYKREAEGLQLDVTVERTTIQGRPGVVLAWPKP